ncbi:unnamed protein product [Owenia fusiformis]|uniref:Uncharacterized protein n=1 Tax=Owenia fusiformis TaxID=6347 RepID=A0A8J1U0R1_OWEFU|nr:unnamed protein product [Owenia fusiformis]
MAGPPKKRKIDISSHFKDNLVHILPKKIPNWHYQLLIKNMTSKGVPFVQNYSPDVTHIVTSYDNVDQVKKAMNITEDEITCHIVKLEWLTHSLGEGKPVEITNQYKLLSVPKKNHEPEVTDSNYKQTKLNCFQVDPYCCQRRTPLQHHNKLLTDAFEILEENAEYIESSNDTKGYSRNLAYRRVLAVLRSLPQAVTSVKQIKDVKHIGGHSQKIIQELLEEKCCLEVEEIKRSVRYNKMKLFTGVFGAGVSTARRWYDTGMTSLNDVIQHNEDRSTAQKYGLAFFDDLNMPVLKAEAEQVKSIVKNITESILPGVSVTVTGGFRRGKTVGHDIDLLISHPKEGAEIGLLGKILEKLQQLNLILYGSHNKCTYSERHFTEEPRDPPTNSQMDHFEKWFGIIGLPKISTEKTVLIAENDASDKSIKDLVDLSKSEKSWTAKRVDLIIVPSSQYFYGLVGWTGNKMFNRDLRLYAQKELNMRLSSHGLYDLTKGCLLTSNSEEEVFKYLKLPVIPPELRNC